jgi:hypothetical protein
VFTIAFVQLELAALKPDSQTDTLLRVDTGDE